MIRVMSPASAASLSITCLSSGYTTSLGESSSGPGSKYELSFLKEVNIRQAIASNIGSFLMSEIRSANRSGTLAAFVIEERLLESLESCKTGANFFEKFFGNF
jgi:hypothetical protein